MTNHLEITIGHQQIGLTTFCGKNCISWAALSKLRGHCCADERSEREELYLLYKAIKL